MPYFRVCASALLFCLVCLVATAAPLFRIQFEGTLTTGSLKSIDDTQTTYHLDLTPGTIVRGVLFFDSALAPIPQELGISPDVLTGYSDALAAPWLFGSIELTFPALPPNALPVPSVHSLLPQDLPSGAVHGVPEARAGLLSHLNAAACCDGFSAGLFFQQNAVFPAGSIFEGFLLNLNVPAFFDLYPAAAPFPTPFSLSGSAGTGNFQKTSFERIDSLTPPLFGVQRNFTIVTEFDLTSVEAGFVPSEVPEPSTAALSLGGLLFLAAALSSRARRWPEQARPLGGACPLIGAGNSEAAAPRPSQG